MKSERPVCEQCKLEMKPSRIDYFCWDVQYRCPECSRIVWLNNNGRRSEGFSSLLEDTCEAINAMNRPSSEEKIRRESVKSSFRKIVVRWT